MLNYTSSKDSHLFTNILDVVRDIYRYVIWITILLTGFDEWTDDINVHGTLSLSPNPASNQS